MKLLVLADTEPEWRSIPEEVASACADAVITVGDLSGGWLERAGLQDVSVPKLGVYGNHCDGQYLERLGVTNLHLLRTEVHGVSFSGLQGCVRYKARGRDILYTQDEYTEMVSALPSAQVLVTHCPPAGINDHADAAHVGITALRNWVADHRPSCVIHGHTYPEQPVRSFGQTRIEYVRGSSIVLAP